MLDQSRPISHHQFALIISLLVLPIFITMSFGQDLHCTNMPKANFNSEYLYPSGERVRGMFGNYFHPNRQETLGFRNRSIYPNGQSVTGFADEYLYPNGKSVFNFFGEMKLPDGSLSSINDADELVYFKEGDWYYEILVSKTKGRMERIKITFSTKSLNTVYDLNPNDGTISNIQGYCIFQ